MSQPVTRVVVVKTAPTTVVVTSTGAQGPPGENLFDVDPDGRVLIDGGPPATSNGA